MGADRMRRLLGGTETFSGPETAQGGVFAVCSQCSHASSCVYLDGSMAGVNVGQRDIFSFIW